jgi:type II secretory pathway pseudopilin PulG
MLAAVLAVLVVVALVGAALTMSLVNNTRQVRKSEQRQQSLWLAESGMQRALARVAAAPDYRGERWSIPKESLDGKNSAVVTIVVEPAKEPQQGLLIRVESSYPDDPVHKVIFHRDRFVPAANQGASS